MDHRHRNCGLELLQLPNHDRPAGPRAREGNVQSIAARRGRIAPFRRYGFPERGGLSDECAVIVVATARMPPAFEQIPHRAYPMFSVLARMKSSGASDTHSREYTQFVLSIS